MFVFLWEIVIFAIKKIGFWNSKIDSYGSYCDECWEDMEDKKPGKREKNSKTKEKKSEPKKEDLSPEGNKKLSKREIKEFKEIKEEGALAYIFRVGLIYFGFPFFFIMYFINRFILGHTFDSLDFHFFIWLSIIAGIIYGIWGWFATMKALEKNEK